MIFISHGVIQQRDEERISHGLMVDEGEYINHLQRVRYVPLSEALAGDGDALTFDDATYAALRGALIARAYGQPVTLFVNGWHVEAQAAYFPFQLSTMLDETRKSQCHLLGRRWNIGTLNDRRLLRKALKDIYMEINDWKSIIALVEGVSHELGVEGIEKGLCTVDRMDLLDAVDAGVSLQSHGWIHLNPQLSAPSKLERELKLNQEWLKKVTGKVSTVYAPPFGQMRGQPGTWKNVVLAEGESERDRLVSRAQLSLERATPELIVNQSNEQHRTPPNRMATQCI